MKEERRATWWILVWVSAALAFPPAVSAWGDKGHRVVGEIAQRHLEPETEEAISRFLGTTSLAQIATWPDFIRSDRKWSFVNTWHYVTVEDDDELRRVLTAARESPIPDNAVEAVEFFEAILRGEQEPRQNFVDLMAENGVEPLMGSLDATALAFLLHFAGDLHQPLHVGRGGDSGGNAITVNWFGETMKLHAVWDSGMIEKQNLSFTELVRFIDQEYEGRAAEWNRARPVEWGLESRALRHEVYDVWRRTDRENLLPDLGYRYSFRQIGTVKRRLFQAGVRLARLLDTIYGADG